MLKQRKSILTYFTSISQYCNRSCIVQAKRYNSSKTDTDINNRIQIYNLLHTTKEELFMNKNASKALESLQQIKNLTTNTTSTTTTTNTSEIKYERLLYKGLSHYLLKEENEAIKTFQEITKAYSCKYSHIGLAEYYKKNQEYDKSLLEILKSLQIDPKYARAKYELSSILLYHFHQYELSISHLNYSVSQLIQPKYKEISLFNDIRSDKYLYPKEKTLHEDNNNLPSLNQTLMNCSTLLYKRYFDFEENNSYYSKLMKNTDIQNSILSLIDKDNTLNSIANIKKQMKPEIGINTLGFVDLGVFVAGEFISSKITKGSNNYTSKIANSPKSNLTAIINFATQMQGKKNITVLLASQFTRFANSSRATDKASDDNKDYHDSEVSPWIPSWRKWLEIYEKTYNGWFDLIPEVKHNFNFPSDWKIHSEIEFFNTKEHLYPTVLQYTPLLNDSTCDSCKESIPGISALALVYSSNDSGHDCTNDKNEIGFYNQKYVLAEKKENVEVTLLDSIANDIYSSDALIVVGDLANVHPWRNLIDIAVAVNIPIAFFSSTYPDLPHYQRFVHIINNSDIENSVKHFIKEYHYFSQLEEETSDKEDTE